MSDLISLWNEVEQAAHAVTVIRLRAERGIVAGPDDWKAQFHYEQVRARFDRAVAAQKAAA